jgi:hypothetical protein
MNCASPRRFGVVPKHCMCLEVVEEPRHLGLNRSGAAAMRPFTTFWWVLGIEATAKRRQTTNFLRWMAISSVRPRGRGPAADGFGHAHTTMSESQAHIHMNIPPHIHAYTHACMHACTHMDTRMYMCTVYLSASLSLCLSLSVCLPPRPFLSASCLVIELGEGS